VVVGGAVALNNPEPVVERMRERVESEVVTNVPEIRLTELGEDVVVEGAVASAMTDGTGDRSRLRQ
jgi:glucokinase